MQKVEAAYLVQKAEILKAEGKTEAPPLTGRQFVLLFHMSEFLPELNGAIDLFFDEVLLPGDGLILITPISRYSLRSDALAKLSLEKNKEQLKAKIRRDIILGNAEYAAIIRDMEQSLNGESSIAESIRLYGTYLGQLEDLRKLSEKGLIDFANSLQAMAGQKNVFLFYQKERIPKLEPERLNVLMSLSQDDPTLVFELLEKFEFYFRDVEFDVKAVKRAFSDSSIAVHFLFLAKTAAADFEITSLSPSKLVMAEQSEDIFSAFREISLATGGFSVSSADARYAFKKASDASETYYLLYYRPLNYVADGKFKEIRVEVKKGNYRVTHRAGYFAD